MSGPSTARRPGLLELLQPAFLTGFTLPDWVRLLRAHRWQVDAEYLPRALVATLGASGTSLLKPFDDRVQLDAVHEEAWRRPVFILGLGRSGTTHLFHLLADDPQFCFPTRFDCHNPHTFLTLRRLGVHRLLGLLPATKRYMDNMKTGWLSPTEDKVALCILTSSGVRMQRVFPRTFDRSREATGARWDIDVQHPGFGEALANFSRKLVKLHGRRPLLKSPDHTTVIPDILRVFPEARFVTILRDPYSQYSSDAAMDRSMARQWSALQRPAGVPDETRLEWITAVLQRYLDTRGLIPKGHLVEIRYRDLVAAGCGRSNASTTASGWRCPSGSASPRSRGTAGTSIRNSRRRSRIASARPTDPSWRRGSSTRPNSRDSHSRGPPSTSGQVRISTMAFRDLGGGEERKAVVHDDHAPGIERPQGVSHVARHLFAPARPCRAIPRRSA